MKKIWFFVFLCTCAAQAYELRGKVVYITDGDSITLLSPDREQHKIRLYGIDAPERRQPFGKKSAEILKNLIKKREVVADCREKDRYQRHVCTIYLGSQDVNAEMVRRGGAWVYRQYYRGDAYYALENEAKAGQRGLWRTSEYQAMPPWEWRKQQREKRKRKPL